MKHTILVAGEPGNLVTKCIAWGGVSSNGYIFTDVAELDITDKGT